MEKLVAFQSAVNRVPTYSCLQKLVSFLVAMRVSKRVNVLKG